MVNPRSDGEIPGTFELRRDSFLSTEFHIVETKSNLNQQRKTEDSKTITIEVFQKTNTNEDTSNVDNCGILSSGCTNMTSFLLDSASDLFPYINKISSSSNSFGAHSTQIRNSNCGFKCGLDFPPHQGADGFDSEEASSQHGGGGVTVVSIEGANVQYFPPRFQRILDTRSKLPGIGLIAGFRNLRDLITQASGLEDPEIESISKSEKVPELRLPVVTGGGFQSLVGSPDTTLRSTSEVQRTTSSQSSQERAVLAESSEFTSVNEYGFFTNEQIEAGLPPVVQLPEASKHFESKRNAKWRRMLSNNAEQNWQSICELQGELLKKRIRKGIPRDWRYRVWPLLTGGQRLLEQHPGEYHRLLRQPCLVERAILDDLHRTLPNHVLFSEQEGQGQQSLFRVLKAYAGFDPELGYAQGTGSILAVLLVVMEEESAFWTFVGLMSNEAHGPRPTTAGPLIKGRNLFLEGTPLTLQVMSQLEHLLDEKLPAIAQKLKDAEIDTSLYATKWCMTLFCFVLPFQHLVRVWDIFFLEGWKIFLRTCLVIIRVLKKRILEEPNEAVGGVLTAKTIAEQLPPPDVFIRMILSTKVSKILSTWRSQAGGPDQP